VFLLGPITLLEIYYLVLWFKLGVRAGCRESSPQGVLTLTGFHPWRKENGPRSGPCRLRTAVESCSDRDTGCRV